VGLRKVGRHQEEPSCLGMVFSAESLSLGKDVTESWSLERRAAAVIGFLAGRGRLGGLGPDWQHC